MNAYYTLKCHVYNQCDSESLVVKKQEIAEKLRYYAKTIGAGLAPFDCFLLERGIKTLAVCLEKQAANAEKIANWLRQRREVRKVYYIGFTDHLGYTVTKRQCSGYGGMRRQVL
ncbi:MAG: PLP-dependent transferase [Victivallales bacterium]|nr:PLP-dependent transferase [Victivallales bacterium]